MESVYQKYTVCFIKGDKLRDIILYTHLVMSAGVKGGGARSGRGISQTTCLNHPQSCRDLHHPRREDPWSRAQGQFCSIT